MHRTFPSLFLCWLGYSLAVAQPPPIGDEWINYRQRYYKIPIAGSGLYRITTAGLRRAGVPTETINPVTIQLFHRGVEQAIYVAGEADNQLDATDFVEFYGRGNDGVPDSILYRPDERGRSTQPHSYYSLFTDTTAYFLTWRLDGQAGRRMAAYTDLDYATLAPDPYHWEEELRLFTDTYPGYPNGIPPKTEYSHYEAGEGYTGAVQQKNRAYDNPFLLSHTLRAGPAPQLELLLAGRDYTGHRVECAVGPATTAQRSLDTVRFSTYDNARIRQPIDWTDVGPDGQLVVSTVSRGDDHPTDRYSVSFIRLRYPQRTTASNQPWRTFRLPVQENGLTRSRLTVTDVLPGTRFWDVTDPTAPVRVGATSLADSARLIVRHTTVVRTIFCAAQPQAVPAIQPVRFADWTIRKPTYLIVSHESLRQPAGGYTDPVQAYAAYRASAAGGGHDTLTVTMQQLFDQFSYGERHPMAIRRFADQLLRQGHGSVQYLLLLGRSRSTPGIRQSPQQASLDLVMTAGYPGSDLLFTNGLHGQPADVPAIPTGRVNAGTPQEVVDYLTKVIDYERQPTDARWRKNILHLSGGQSPGEARTFRQLMDTYRDKAVAQSLGARVTTLAKETDNPVERINVAKPVNDGVGLMTFFGHSGLVVTDLDIGFCSNEELGYQNKGRYPVMLINGCAIGNFFFGRPTLTADWVLTPNRGAIAAIAQSNLGYVDFLNHYSTAFYTVLADSNYVARSIGQIQQETIRRVLAQHPGGGDLANCQQMVLQGDPAIRPFPFETPDYALSASELSIRDTHNQPLSLHSDSVRVRGVIQNFGQYRPGPLPVRVRRFINGQESGVVELQVPNAVAYRDTITLTLPNERNAQGQNRFELTINPAGQPATPATQETNRTNNQAAVEVTIAGPTTALPDGQLRLATVLPDDIRQGDVVLLPVQFVNLSSYPFADSLVVRQTIYAPSLSQPQTSQWLLKAPVRGDTLRFTTRIETEQIPGINRLVLTVNPRLQAEYSFLNNTIDLPMTVQPDRFGPVLEVAFDGARIENGAVVSARPIIDVLVADDNRSLIRRDTLGLNLFLQRPGGAHSFERISWRDATISSTGTDTLFRLRYASATLPPGEYWLLVTARDAVGNPAAPYTVQFRVVHERSLTDLTVYPNPFRDQVLFACQLTGDQSPGLLAIHISDLTGREVCVLKYPARIGLNEWSWDGRGSSGDRLPAGLYLYRLTIPDVAISDQLRNRLTGRLVLIR